MPKIKTHSGAKKRFSVTGSGKVKFQHTNKRHRLTQKAVSYTHLTLPTICSV